MVLRYGKTLTAKRVDISHALPSAPQLLLGRTAAVSDLFPANVDCYGQRVLTGASCGTDVAEVRLKAFAELVERISALEAGHELRSCIRETAIELKRRGVLHIPPSQFQFFGRRTEGIEREPDNKPITWYPAQRISTNEKVLVPALMVFLKWQPPKGEQIFAKPNATGLAAGRDAGSAMTRAILEVVERDHCMMSWFVEAFPVKRIESQIISKPIRDACTSLQLECRLFVLADVESVPPTILALLCGENGERLTCGSACGCLDGRHASKAVSEALMLQVTMQSANGGHHFRRLCPRTTYEHVANAYVSGAKIAAWYDRGNIQRRLQDGCSKYDVKSLCQALEKYYGGTVLLCDVSSETAKTSGWYVYRALIPTAVPMESDFLLAHQSHPRLKAFLQSIGLSGQSIRDKPHPFG